MKSLACTSAVVCSLGLSVAPRAQTPATKAVTFTKDVAPRRG